jgi:Domain of unknown function (DU1801)
MAKNKTSETTVSVAEFINKIDNETKRDDAFQLVEIFKEVTGFEEKMWGPSIIGFGFYHYKYASGHEGDMPLAGFSPRKSAIVLYLFTGLEKKAFLEKLGKHKGGKGCVYIKKLEDINISVLKKMIAASVKSVKKEYGVK